MRVCKRMRDTIMIIIHDPGEGGIVCLLVGCLMSQQHAGCISGTYLVKQVHMLPQ